MRFKVGLVSVAAAVLLAPASAFANSATMFSEAGDYIGGGREVVFDTQKGDVVNATLDQTGGGLSVGVSGGPYGESYSMSFASAGGPLVPGTYVGAQRASFREAGRPGIDISGDGRGCNEQAGSFEIRDLTRNPDGTIASLWLVYEQHCEGGTPALFGEVRVTPAPALTTPSLVRWPALDLGGGGQAVPVIVGGGNPITSVSLTGNNPKDFVVRIDNCSGKPAPCEVWVRFVPTAAGTRSARLHLTNAAGGAFDVLLHGFAYGGTTNVVMTSDPGDYIGGGITRSYGPDSSIAVGGSRTFIGAGVDGVNGDYWTFDFAPPAGDVLAPGTYSGATRYPFNGQGAGLSVYGNGSGCNELNGSFTVNELEFAGADVRSASISFEQHCEHAVAALRGTVNFRAGDRTPLAPWMAAAPVVTPDDPGAADVPPPPPPALVAPPSGVAKAPSLALQRARVSRSSHALVAAAAKLKPSKVKALRSSATRLAADLKLYRETLVQAKAKRALVKAVDKHIAALKTFRRALSRYASGHSRAKNKRAVLAAARKLKAADKATAKAAR